MRSAPPVVYPVGRFLWRRPAAFGFLVLLSAWIWQPWLPNRTLDGLMLWGSLALQCLLVGRLGWWIRSPAREIRQLRWDGSQWFCETTANDELPVVLEVHADFQRCVWLSVKRGVASTAEGAQRWSVCVRASDKPAVWHGFRCALYCRQQRADEVILKTEAGAGQRR